MGFTVGLAHTAIDLALMGCYYTASVAVCFAPGQVVTVTLQVSLSSSLVRNDLLSVEFVGFDSRLCRASLPVSSE